MHGVQARNKLELVAPAGNPEKLKIAVLYGADAVYLGGREFSLRAEAGNFNEEEMQEGIRFAHEHGVKAYIAVNVFARNRDIEKLPAYLELLAGTGADGVIASDPGIIALIREKIPHLPVHISTQANTTNWLSARFWEHQGVKRIVLARELSLKEIREIASRVNAELEAFVHGAMCMAYSGRCLLSSVLTGRDANQGDCAQPCRWKYYLLEEKRPGQYFPVEEDQRGSYILSSRDLCLIDYIPNLAEAGVTAFKIEGRMKSIHYLATAVKVYRQAIDSFIKNPSAYRVLPEWLEELSKISTRDYTTGFLSGQEKVAETGVRHIPSPCTFVGLVLGYDSERNIAIVEQRNNFKAGERLEVLTPRGENARICIKAIYDRETGEEIKAAPHPRQTVLIPIGMEIPPMSMLRRIEAHPSASSTAKQSR